jgi:hypothetical protein
MPIQVTCSCGKTLQVDEKHRGKKIKCPACGAMAVATEASTAVQSEEPKRPRINRDDDAPAKKKKPAAKSNKMLWLAGAGCAVLALFGCVIMAGGGTWLMIERKRDAAEQARIEEARAKKEAEETAAKVRRAAERTKSVNNLKQIALGMHSYHDAFKGLPNGAIRHPQTSQPLLSWRVALLPFLEEGPLSQEIRMNERWDSEHNKKFWTRMPKVYQLPGKASDDKTYYQVFRGPETAFPDMPFNAKLHFNQFRDGTSNTILIIEAVEPINWMRPDDLPFQMNNPAMHNQLGNHWENGTCLVAFTDGSVRSLKRDITPQALQGLLTRGGAEIVDFAAWEGR